MHTNDGIDWTKKKVADLRAELDARGIAHDLAMHKDDLIALIARPAASSEDKIRLADQLQSIINREACLVRAARVLQSLGSVEQAEREANERLSRVREELAGIEGRLAAQKTAASADIDAAKAEAASIRNKAAKDAESAKTASDLACHERHERLKDESNKILAEAKAKADAEIAAASSLAAQHRAAAENAKSQYNALQAQIDAQASELASLESRLAKAKEQVAKLLG